MSPGWVCSPLISSADTLCPCGLYGLLESSRFVIRTIHYGTVSGQRWPTETAVRKPWRPTREHWRFSQASSAPDTTWASAASTWEPTGDMWWQPENQKPYSGLRLDEQKQCFQIKIPPFVVGSRGSGDVPPLNSRSGDKAWVPGNHQDVWVSSFRESHTELV